MGVSVHHAISHVFPGAPVILLVVVIVGVVIFVGMTRRRS